MDLKGLYHICGNVASKTCKVCGRAACDNHLRVGVCDTCRAGKIQGVKKG